MSQHWEWLQFGGIRSRDYDVWISGANVWSAPERDVEVVEIPGRNGTLSLDNGRYKNVSIVYPCYMSGNFSKDFDTFKVAMLSQTGYLRLSDTYHPDHFRMARLTGGFKPKPGPYNRSAKFDLTFDCYPQLFLRSGDTAVTITSTKTMENPTQFATRPQLIIGFTPDVGTIQPKSGTVSIVTTDGGMIPVTTTQTITFTNIPFTTAQEQQRGIVIDCETGTIQRRDTYENLSAYAQLTTGDFFELPGKSVTAQSFDVSFTGDVSYISLTPRWWTL